MDVGTARLAEIVVGDRCDVRSGAMTDLAFDALASIDEHSAGVGTLAPGNLAAAVPGCPGWNLADLVAHLTEVQWFWATIVEHRLVDPPEEDQRPPRAPEDELVSALTEQTAHLVRTLRDADPRTRVWTWAPQQQDVAFVARHQVQEAAVHHWDAGSATGHAVVIERPLAVDAIEEFLTFSVSSDDDAADPPRPSLAGRFALSCTDGPEAWTVRDGRAPGMVHFEAGAAPGVPMVAGTASDLLLWLYRRIPLDTGAVPAELVARFAGLTFTS